MRQFERAGGGEERASALAVFQAEAFLPMVVATLVFLACLGNRGSLDGHEVLVAQTAREMLRSGDWVVPQFAGNPRYEKPPLGYWVTALSYTVTGRATPFSARLPAALASILAVGLIAWFAGRVFGPPAGLIAGLIHASTYWTIAYGKLALVDALLVLLVTAAVLLAAADRLFDLSRGCGHVFGFWILCGLVVLAKGPAGLAIVLPAAVGYRLLRTSRATDRPFFRRAATVPALGVGLLLALTWPAAMYLHDPAVLDAWRGQTIDRFLFHWGPSTRPWYYYLYEIPLLALPWSGLWAVELVNVLYRRLYRRDNQTRLDDERKLLWLWLVSGVVFFTLSAGKRAHYILPALPPLSILAALGALRLQSAAGKWAFYAVSQWRRALRMLAATLVLGTALAGAAIGGGWWFTAPLLMAGILGCLATGAFWLRQPAHRPAAIICFTELAALVILFELVVTPQFLRRDDELALLARHRARLERAQQVVQFGSNDRWAVFAIDRPMIWARVPDDLLRCAQEHGGLLVLVPQERLETVRRHLPGKVVDAVVPTPSLNDAAARALVLYESEPLRAAGNQRRRDLR